MVKVLICQLTLTVYLPVQQLPILLINPEPGLPAQLAQLSLLEEVVVPVLNQAFLPINFLQPIIILPLVFLFFIYLLILHEMCFIIHLLTPRNELILTGQVLLERPNRHQ